MAETSTDNPVKTPRLGLASGLLIGGLAMLLLVLLAGRAQSGMMDKLWSTITGRKTTIISQGAVVQRIQRLQRMETVVYNMDKIVTGQKETLLLPDFLAGDKMLLIVHGQVIAGIDFEQLRASDIQITGKEIHLKLPAPRILVTRIDNARTRVYSRTTGLLVPMDPNLESQVRQQAEGELLDEAGRSGILTTARQNARTTLTSFLLGMGFEKVEVE
ncbi:MAG: DUF4230 domain-containing protein [Acidobacteriia bacterium]|nr:DUF4230 domain-containing protein [Terriglobia bacterium]